MAEKTIGQLNKFLELRSHKVKKLHVEQVRRTGTILKNDYSLSSFGTLKNETLEEIKNSKYNDLQDMVYRFKLTYDEVYSNINYRKHSTNRNI